MRVLKKSEMDLIQTAQEFTRNQIALNAPAWEHDRHIGLETIKKAAKFGFTGLQVPVSNGGLGFSFFCKARILETFAGEDFGFDFSLVNTHKVPEKPGFIRKPTFNVTGQHSIGAGGFRLDGCEVRLDEMLSP